MKNSSKWKKNCSPDTFIKNYVFKKTEREDLKVFFSLINKVRELSTIYLYNEESKLEYFISLFMITLRQVRYPDLNQLYALKSAEILGEAVLKMLKAIPNTGKQIT